MPIRPGWAALRRAPLWVGALVVSLMVLAVSLLGGLVLLAGLACLIVVAACCRPVSRDSWLASLPIAGLGLIVGAVMVGLGADALGADLYGGDPDGVALVLATAIAASLMLASGRLALTVESTRLWAFVPAAVMAVLTLVPALAGAGSRAMFAFTGDNWRHLMIVTRTFHSGSLDYGTTAYPRGWHAVVASLWSVSPPGPTGAGLESALRYSGTVYWWGATLFVLAATLLAVSIGDRVGLRGRQRAFSGLLTGSLLLTPWFVPAYLLMGFQTTLVAALAVIVSVWAVLSDAGMRLSIVVAALAAVTVSHSWQLLVPMTVAPFLVLLMRGRTVRQRFLVLVGAAGALALSVPAFLGLVAGGVGLGHTAAPGAVPPWPVWLVGLSALALVAAWPRQGGVTPSRTALNTHPAFLLGLTWTAGVAVVALLCWRFSLGVDDYYPNKILWVSVVITLPLCAVVFMQVQLTWIGGGSVARTIARGLAVVARAIVVAGPMIVATSALGLWTVGMDGDRVVKVSTGPSAARATVVWAVGSEDEDEHVQGLTGYYRAWFGAVVGPDTADTVPEQCRLLAASRSPLILTSADARAVRERFSCAPTSSIVTVQNLNPSSIGSSPSPGRTVDVSRASPLYGGARAR